MPTTNHWTSKDLEALPQKEGTRYEIIDGESHVSTLPSWHHQYTCSHLTEALSTWGRAAVGNGRWGAWPHLCRGPGRGA